MTKEREHIVRVAQRQMMWKIVQTGRRKEKTSTSTSDSSSTRSSGTCDDDLEDWVDWIKRATGIAEQKTNKSGVEDWVNEQAKRKFLWAGHVARRDDGRWNEKLLHWWPEGERSREHPKRRWSDVFDAYFEEIGRGEWLLYTGNRPSWAELAENFVEFSTDWTGN
jgi:hypothetical protein